MVTTNGQTKEHEFAPYFRSHEGVIDHFYLDKVGLVTVAVGLMVPDRTAAARLNLVHLDGRPATDAAKREEWSRIKAMEPDRIASWYKSAAQLRMPAEEIGRLLDAKLLEFEVYLRKMFMGYDSFPGVARLGLVDMIYSLGAAGLRTKFPNFCAAVREGHWHIAATNCDRKNVSPDRNKDCRQLFESASMLATKGPVS